MTRPKNGTIIQSVMFLIMGAALFGIQSINMLKFETDDIKSRSVASIPLNEDNRWEKVHPSFSVKIDCQDQTTVEKADQYPFVRIAAGDCPRRSGTPEVQVTNLTNGYRASVLPLGNSGFTSDLIRLRPGTNRILVVQSYEDGSDFRRMVTVINNSRLYHPE